MQEASEQPAYSHAYTVVVDKAIDVLGDSAKAFRWIGMPVRALGNVTPASLMDSDSGRKRIVDVLEELEYGLF